MQRLVHIPGEFEIWSTALTQPSDFRSPFAGEEFNLLLIAGHTDWDEEQRVALVRSVLRENCPSVVSVGPNADRWEDDFDELAAFEERFILTSPVDTPDQAIAHGLQLHGTNRTIRLLLVSIGDCSEASAQTLAMVAEEFADRTRREARRLVLRTYLQIRDTEGQRP